MTPCSDHLHCVICNATCDESGLCAAHQYDDEEDQCLHDDIVTEAGEIDVCHDCGAKMLYNVDGSIIGAVL